MYLDPSELWGGQESHDSTKNNRYGQPMFLAAGSLQRSEGLSSKHSIAHSMPGAVSTPVQSPAPDAPSATSFSTICVLQTQRLSESHGTHSEASHTAFSISALSSESRRSFENSPLCFVSRVSLSLAAWPRWWWTLDSGHRNSCCAASPYNPLSPLQTPTQTVSWTQDTAHWTKTLCTLIISR